MTLVGQALSSPVNCAISREAMEDHFGTDNLGQQGRLEAFLKNRSRIEAIARVKYLSAPIGELCSVLIKTSDVEPFSREFPAGPSRALGKKPAAERK